MCKKCIAKKVFKPLLLTPFIMITWAGADNILNNAFSLNNANFYSKSFAQKQIISGFFDNHAYAAEQTGKGIKWTCPMHPHYISDDAGTCPICGMDLVKLETGEATQDSKAQTEERPAISIEPQVIQSMGIRLAKAEKATFGKSIRSYGVVEANERLRLELSGRLEGWIEKLNITAVGDEVKKGDVLFELFSPELFVSQRDYLTALKEKDPNRITALEKRLASYGVQPQAIELLKSKGEALDRVPYYADQDGIVSGLEVISGSYIKRGTKIATIQDYSQVWLQVSVAEKDLAQLKKDTTVTVRFPNLTEKQITSKIDYIYPTVDMRTRTGKVRIVIDNEDGLLKPGTFSDVTFGVDTSQRLAVPTEAILKNSNSNFVIASLGEGKFEPRSVNLGIVAEDWTEITSGIKAGEEVVTSGQFLIDSESALRESFQKIQKMQMPLSLLKPDQKQLAMIDHLVDAALYLHEALVDRYAIDGKQLDAALGIKQLLWPAYRDTKLAFVLDDAEKALKLAQAAKTDSESHQALSSLSKALKSWILIGPVEHYKSHKIFIYQDPDSQMFWLQKGETVMNPYGKAKPQAVTEERGGDEIYKNDMGQHTHSKSKM